MTEYYERYVISELPPKSILDQNTGDTIPLEDEGVFETICELLNRQNIIMESRNKTIKFHVDGYNQVIQTIKEAYETERTAIGKSVLKQLADSLGVEYEDL